MVSIGTGYQVKPTSPRAPNFRNILQDGALVRLYRASMPSLSLNGENCWQDHFYGLEKDIRASHFRPDLPLQSKEPRINDVEKMPLLQDLTQSHAVDLEEIARALKATSFFLELNTHLVRKGHSYTCYGSILCRSPNNQALVDSILAEFPSATFDVDNISLGALSQSDVCGICGRFQKCVMFQVNHRDETITI